MAPTLLKPLTGANFHVVVSRFNNKKLLLMRQALRQYLSIAARGFLATVAMSFVIPCAVASAMMLTILLMLSLALPAIASTTAPVSDKVSDKVSAQQHILQQISSQQTKQQQTMRQENTTACAQSQKASCLATSHLTMPSSRLLASLDRHWFDTMQFSLLLNGDAFFQTNYQSLSLDGGADRGRYNSGFSYNMRFNIDSQLNQWVAAHLGLFAASARLSTPQGNDVYDSAGSEPFGISGGYATRYYVDSDVDHGVDADEVYLTVANANKFPAALRIGRQYMPFGQYDINAMMPSLYDQAVTARHLSMTGGYYGQFGNYDQNSFSLQGFAFNGLHKQGAATGVRSNHINSWGASINFITSSEKMVTNLQASYLDNYLNTGLLSQALMQQEELNDSERVYHNGVGAVAFDATADVRRFMLAAHYVLPTGSINANQLYNYRHGAIDTNQAARPSAGTVVAALAFDQPFRPSQISVSYQWSRDYALYTTYTANNQLQQANVATMAKQAVVGQYTMALFARTELGLVLAWDQPYSQSDGGSGNQDSVITGLARLSVLLG